MLIYLLILIAVILSFFLSNERLFVYNKRKILPENYTFLFIAVLLVVISAVRFEVGTDYLAYKKIYETAIYEIEPFLEFFANIARYFDNYQIVIIISALVTNIGFFYIVKKEKINSILSIFVYFSFGFYTTFFNIFRQGNAIALVMLAIYFLSKKKYIKFFIFSFFAINAHSTALIALVLSIGAYYCTKVNFFNKKTVYLFLLLSFALLILLPQMDFFSNITGLPGMDVIYNRYFIYRSPYTYPIPFKFTTFIRVILQIIFFTILIKNYDWESQSIFTRTSIILSTAYILLFSFKQNSEVVNRFLIYFQIFMILSIPQLIDSIKNKNKYLFAILFLIAYGTIIFFINMTNNAGEVIPYKIY